MAATATNFDEIKKFQCPSDRELPGDYFLAWAMDNQSKNARFVFVGCKMPVHWWSLIFLYWKMEGTVAVWVVFKGIFRFSQVKIMNKEHTSSDPSGQSLSPSQVQAPWIQKCFSLHWNSVSRHRESLLKVDRPDQSERGIIITSDQSEASNKPVDSTDSFDDNEEAVVVDGMASFLPELTQLFSSSPSGQSLQRCFFLFNDDFI